MLTRHLVGLPSGIDKHAISSFTRTQDSLSALLRLNVCVCVCVSHFSSVQLLSRVRLFVTPMNCSTPGLPVHHQVPNSRPLSWWCHPTISSSVIPFSSHLDFSSPGDLPNPWIKPRSPALRADSLPAEPQGRPRIMEWVDYPISRESSQPRNQTSVSCIAGIFFINWAIKEAHDKNFN